MAMTNCGGGGTSSTTTTTTTSTAAVSDLSDVPDPNTAYAKAADASLSAALSRFAVSGTPPKVSEITPATALAYFWSDDGGITNVIDTINDAGTATQDQADRLWQGEFACRMAQTVGHIGQELQSVGMSTCMLKNLTSDAVVNSGGETLVSGEIADLTQLFVQDETTRHVRIDIAGMPEFETPEDADLGAPERVDIIVHGTSSVEGADAYDINLIQCNSSNVPLWVEKTRVTADTFTIKMSDTGYSANFTLDGTFGVIDSGDGVIIDPESDRSIGIYVDGFNGGNNFKFKALVGITSGGALTIRAVDSFDQGSGRVFVESAYQEDAGDLQMESAEGQLHWDAMSEPEIKGVEFQDDSYAAIALADISSTVTGFDFDADSFFTETLAADSEIAGFLTDTTLAGYCTATPDVEVTLDFSVAELLAVLSTCEPQFNDMNFCEGDAVSAARQIIFESEGGGPPE